MRTRFAIVNPASAGSMVHVAIGTTASVGLSACVPTGTTQILMSASGGDLRFTWDNTAPSLNYGLIVKAAQQPYAYTGPNASLNFIAMVAASADFGFLRD